MSELNDFLEMEIGPIENEKVIVSKRLKNKEGEPLEFEVRALTEKEMKEIKKACSKKVKSGKKFILEENGEMLEERVLIESIVTPCLKSEALQAKFKVNKAEDVLPVMLTAGEYQNLVTKVLSISGFGENEEDMGELVEEAKN